MKTSTRLLLSAAGLAIVPALAAAQLQLPPDPAPAQPVRAHAAPRSIFTPVAPPEDARPLPQAVSFSAATVDFDYVKHIHAGDTIELGLAPGVTELADITSVTRRADDKLTIIGSLVGKEHSEVVLVMQVDALAGDITSPHDNMHYKLKFGGGGVHLICNISDDKYLSCAGSEPPPLLPPSDPVPDADDGMNLPPGGGDTEGVCSNAQTVFDGMIAYDDDARVAAGGTSAIIAECYAAEARTNLSYSNSGIAARYRIVWLGEVSYAESGNSSTDLGRLSDPNDGFFDSLLVTKDSINADSLTLWVDTLDACGRGYCQSSTNNDSVQVVAWTCAAGNLSHPHEIGHNQGCDHDRANGGGGCGAFSYSYGWRWFGTDNVQYRSVMAYDPGTRVPHFSNPNVNYQGRATGTATDDNHRTINNTRGDYEDIQLTRFDIWVQIGYVGVEIGTFSLPYNSVSEGVTNIQVPDAQASEPPNLYCKSGTSTYTGTISKQMTIRACGGAFNIGGTP